MTPNNPISVIDKAEQLIDTICKHLSIENCDHCKRLLKESFEEWK
jgi:hypothetical protein